MSPIAHNVEKDGLLVCWPGKGLLPILPQVVELVDVGSHFRTELDYGGLLFTIEKFGLHPAQKFDHRAAAPMVVKLQFRRFRVGGNEVVRLSDDLAFQEADDVAVGFAFNCSPGHVDGHCHLSAGQTGRDHVYRWVLLQPPPLSTWIPPSQGCPLS